MEDKLIRGLALNDKVRVFAVTTTNLVEESRRQHNTWPTSIAALGRLMTANLMVAANLKEENEKITMQINGDGPIGTILTVANSKGQVKGFVADPGVYLTYNDSSKLAVGVGVGRNGFLRVTRDLGRSDAKNSKFTSEVALVSGEIAEDVAYYYATSEQTNSLVSLGVLVEPEGSVIASGGLMIQLMPDAVEEDIVKVENATKDLKAISTLINEGQDAETLVKNIFPDFRKLEEHPVELHCDCSKDRIKGSLSTLPIKDLQEMLAEDHGAEVVCEFCNTKYDISEEELGHIISFKQSLGAKI